jgi:SAM-dependent methyltransferase
VSQLLSKNELADSWVVANSWMNRERGLRGANSYAKDLRADPIALLPTDGAWLDLCCGSGRALIEAASENCGLRILGVDLVPMFRAGSAGLPNLKLAAASLEDWAPEQDFDLITCVHGLHYLGDKLGLIARACTWLKPQGRFLAHLDPHNLRHGDGRDGARAAIRTLRSHGVDFDSRSGLLSAVGPCTIATSWAYLGADLSAGPNRTGQDAVNSHYRFD